MLLSDLTKLAVAVADVDRFCWNLVTCLQCCCRCWPILLKFG